MDKIMPPPSDWKLPSFELEPVPLREMNAGAISAQSFIADTIERLCEKAKAKGPNIQLVVGSLEQDCRTFGWRLPYAFVEAPAHVRPGYQVFGPWPEAAELIDGAP